MVYILLYNVTDSNNFSKLNKEASSNGRNVKYNKLERRLYNYEHSLLLQITMDSVFRIHMEAHTSLQLQSQKT